MENREKGKLFQFKLTVMEMKEFKRKRREQRIAEGLISATDRDQQITEMYSEDSDENED